MLHITLNQVKNYRNPQVTYIFIPFQYIHFLYDMPGYNCGWQDVSDINSFDNFLHAYILAIYTDMQKKCSICRGKKTLLE